MEAKYVLLGKKSTSLEQKNSIVHTVPARNLPHLFEQGSVMCQHLLDVDLIADQETDFDVHRVQVLFQRLIGPDHFGDLAFEVLQL